MAFALSASIAASEAVKFRPEKATSKWSFFSPGWLVLKLIGEFGQGPGGLGRLAERPRATQRNPGHFHMDRGNSIILSVSLQLLTVRGATDVSYAR